MATDEIRGGGYTVRHDRAAHAVLFEGSLRLRRAADYAPILALLEQAWGSRDEPLTVDLRALQFLNSAGIQALLMLAARLRDAGRSGVLRGSSQVRWHGQLLTNLQQLFPAFVLRLE